MGNKKNKESSHLSRKWQKKRYLPAKSKFKENVPPLASNIDGNLDGCRIINLEQLAAFIQDVNVHSQLCQLGRVSLIGEIFRNGTASILRARCSSCNCEIEFPTSHRVDGIGKGRRWESNVAAVWGQMVTGGGHARLKETMSLMGIPVMTKKSFVATEKLINKRWYELLEESMKEAAEEEKKKAIEKGSYHEGVPAITVILDAGWCKRAHKHSYNAKSGAGIIIGMETKKLLYMGVRNKYCSVCAQAESLGKEAPEHDCYKNWTGSSSSMESDIIVQGFQEAESKYGLRYINFVGDGDSSVYPSLIAGVPQWGHAIRKIECANHAIKCYRGALEKLALEKPQYRGKGKLTVNMRKRLTKAARCALKMRSTIPDRKHAANLLRTDLRNSPMHCFGIHTECSTDYCQVVKNAIVATDACVLSTGSDINVPGNAATMDTSVGGTETGGQGTSNADCLSMLPGQSMVDIASEAVEEWQDALDEENMEDVRCDATVQQGGPDPTMMWDIQRIVTRLIEKADQLLGKMKYTV